MTMKGVNTRSSNNGRASSGVPTERARKGGGETPVHISIVG